MPFRPGSSEARDLHCKDSIDVTEWVGLFNSYDSVIEAMNGSDKKGIQDLDHFWRFQYPVTVHKRDVEHLVLVELSQIMKWKLLRGKARPLQKLVDSNDAKTVINASTLAFSLMSSAPHKNWMAAFDSLCQLKGIGEATASAILAPMYPNDCPFMADEVIEACTGGDRKYDRKTYRLVRESLISKAKQLNSTASAVQKDGQHVWTAEDVGRALWVRAKLEVYSICQISTCTNSSSKAEVQVTSSLASSKKRTASDSEITSLEVSRDPSQKRAGKSSSQLK